MMDTRIIEFGEEFRVATGTSYTMVDSVTLKMPGYKSFRVHAAMTQAVKRARVQALGMIDAKALENLRGLQAVDVDAETEPEDPAVFLNNLQEALPEDEYARFYERVKGFLTGNASLATMGDTEAPLNDEFWETVGEKFGVAGWDRIIGGFTGFFG